MKVSLKGVTVRFGDVTAVDGVTFDVAPGAVFALLGRNGAGKSTLVRALLGLVRADEGTIALDGSDPWRDRARLLARIGATPESPDAPEHSGLGEIAAAIEPLYPRWDDALLRARLARFDIDPARPFATLSRGQRALGMLALALAHAPELLVLDDPTLGIDAVARRYVLEELIAELADRGATVVMTSHDLDGVARVATDLAILRAGRLVARGTLDELRARADDEGSGGAGLEEILVAATSGGDRS
jgi:ABC-2 type transport system ATP-binding protein